MSFTNHGDDGGPFLSQRSQAIHVEADTLEDDSLPPPDHPTSTTRLSPTKSPDPHEGTRTITSAQRIDSPSASGHSQAIRSSIDSPQWFDDLLGYIFDGPQIHGKSQAIHVHGEVDDFEDVPPWRICDCPDGGGGGGGDDTHGAGVPDSIDEFDRLVTGQLGVATSGDEWEDAVGFLYGVGTPADDGMGGVIMTTPSGVAHVAITSDVLPWSGDFTEPFETLWRWRIAGHGTEGFQVFGFFWNGGLFTVASDLDNTFHATTYGSYIEADTCAVAIDIQGHGLDGLDESTPWLLTRIRFFDGDVYARTWPDGADESDDWDYVRPGTVSQIAFSTINGLSGGDVYRDIHIDWIRQVIVETGEEGGDDGTDYGCEECAGQQPFQPGYLPIFRPQIGDPTTDLDAHICNLESAAMALDWQTRGRIQLWGGELVPWCGRTRDEIINDGTTQDNARQAWQHFGEKLEVRSGGSWASVEKAIDEGRAIILAGDYGELTGDSICQPGYTGNHSVFVVPSRRMGKLLVGDPLCNDYHYIEDTELQAYAEAFGVAEWGVTSPQKLIFSVTKAWDFGAGPGELLWPVQGYVTQEYGCTGFYLEPPRGPCAHFHDGIDIATALGTPVIACADGVVGFIGFSTTGSWMVRVEHGGGLATRVGHMQEESLVTLGEAVTRGQVIGHIGLTGNTTGPHTHFEVLVDSADINPRLKTKGNP